MINFNQIQEKVKNLYDKQAKKIVYAEIKKYNKKYNKKDINIKHLYTQFLCDSARHEGIIEVYEGINLNDMPIFYFKFKY